MDGGYTDIRIERDGAVATISMGPSGDVQYEGPQPRKLFPKHKELGQALIELRQDSSVRVIVLTSRGPTFFNPPSGAPGPRSRHDPGEDWDLSVGLAQTLHAFVETEKPIIAKVNGDAVGFGSSLMFASDLIVAREDAVIVDYHLGMGETGYGRSDLGVVPGDGGAAFVPLHLPPAIAKEYLFLAKPYTGRELADMGIINRAVPADQLDATVADLCERLLKRTPYALAWAKRVVNRRVAEHVNLTFDAAWAYEMLGFYQGMHGEGERGRSRL